MVRFRDPIFTGWVRVSVNSIFEARHRGPSPASQYYFVGLKSVTTQWRRRQKLLEGVRFKSVFLSCSDFFLRQTNVVLSLCVSQREIVCCRFLRRRQKMTFGWQILTELSSLTLISDCCSNFSVSGMRGNFVFLWMHWICRCSSGKVQLGGEYEGAGSMLSNEQLLSLNKICFC